MTDTTYKTMQLHRGPYLRRAAAANLLDDGLIDTIAVQEYASGWDVRLTPREVVCVVYELNRVGQDDGMIAQRIGSTDDGVLKIRRRHGIDPVPREAWETRRPARQRAWSPC